MRTLGSALLSTLLALGLGGCPSTSVYRTAEPVAPGTWRLSAATGAGSIADREQESQIPTGQLELSARRGLIRDLDVGGKLYISGAELNATWRVHRGRWSWALAPYLSGTRTRESNISVDAIHLFAGSALIASRALSEHWVVSTGPMLGYGVYWPETGGSAQGGWLGGFVHGEWRFSERWRLTPELGVYRVVAGEVPVRGGAIHLGTALSWSL